jgi:hypothetical protein
MFLSEEILVPKKPLLWIQTCLIVVPYFWNITGLYYKHMTIINNDSSIFNKLGASFTDDVRVVIYIIRFSTGHTMHE